MLPNWILGGKYGRSSSRGRNSSRARSLRVERLETRSLLSGVPGLGGIPWGYGGHGSSNTASQLVFEAESPRATVQAGVPLTVQLVAANSRGVIIPTFSDNVTLASSDNLATLTLAGSTTSVPLISTSAVVLPFVDGVATFSVTFNTAGADTLTATDTTSAALDTQGMVKVVAPNLVTQLAVLVPHNVQAGVQTTVLVEALNAQNTIVSGFSDTVTLGSTDSAISVTLPSGTAVTLSGGSATATPISFSGGVATLLVTFNTAGSQSLTATDTAAGSKLTGTGTTNVIAPLVATKLEVVSLPTKVKAGTAYTVQVMAVNAQGVPIQGFSDKVTLTSSDGAATVTLPGSTTAVPLSPTSAVVIQFSDGISTFLARFATNGPQSLTATDSTNTKLVATGNTTVSSGTTTPTPPTTVPTPPAAPTTPTNPAPSTTTSSNWAGYAAATNLNNPATGSVSYVAGSWKVPAVTGTGTAYSAVWVGIDGYTSNTVEQIGTESDVASGTPSYYAWYEMYPQGYVTVPLTISAGDSISASVSYASGQFTVTITDNTTGKSYSPGAISVPGRRSRRRSGSSRPRQPNGASCRWPTSERSRSPAQRPRSTDTAARLTTASIGKTRRSTSLPR